MSQAQARPLTAMKLQPEKLALKLNTTHDSVTGVEWPQVKVTGSNKDSKSRSGLQQFHLQR